MIIRYYDSALTFESSETIDYYEDYATLSAGNGGKFLSYPNQRFARALRQTRLTYIHGIGSAGVLDNEDFSKFGMTSFDPWIFTQQTTSDTAQQIFNPSSGSGQYYTLINLDNLADDTIPANLSRLTQVGNFVSSAGAATQLRFTVRVKFTPVNEIPIEPDPYPKRYWYMRVGSNYYNATTNAWVGSLVWNEFDPAELFFDLNYQFVTYSYTTPTLPASGIAEVGLTGTSGNQNFITGMAYDLAEIDVIIDGIIEDSYTTRYQANIPTRASLIQEIGPVLVNDGPSSGNPARLTRDADGNLNTTSWGGAPLPDALTGRWLGVLRANRRLIEGSTIGIDENGRISRGLYYEEKFYVPIYAEWLAKSRTWSVRLHEFATDETGITFNLLQQDDRRNKSGDIYEEPDVTPPAPTVFITSIHPSAVVQGTTVDISISGGSFTVSTLITLSTADVTINSTTFVDAENIDINVTVDVAATIGLFTITATDGDDSFSLVNALSVAIAPCIGTISGNTIECVGITSISPTTFEAGNTQEITVTGLSLTNVTTFEITYADGASASGMSVQTRLNINNTTDLIWVSASASVSGIFSVKANSASGSAILINSLTITKPPCIGTISGTVTDCYPPIS